MLRVFACAFAETPLLLGRSCYLPLVHTSLILYLQVGCALVHRAASIERTPSRGVRVGALTTGNTPNWNSEYCG